MRQTVKELKICCEALKVAFKITKLFFPKINARVAEEDSSAVGI